MSTKITGFAWPFAFENGRVATSTDEEHLKDNIMHIVGTAKPELLMAPDFGCDLHRRVFDPINTMALAEGDLMEAIARYEPRVNVLSIEVNP